MYCGCPTFGGIVTEYDSHLYRLSASTGDVRNHTNRGSVRGRGALDETSAVIE
jgi:hypothetical protein